jgi:hypothetical protein
LESEQSWMELYLVRKARAEVVKGTVFIDGIKERPAA